jgi:hypothetical protein
VQCLIDAFLPFAAVLCPLSAHHALWQL